MLPDFAWRWTISSIFPGYDRLLSLASIVKLDLRSDEKVFRAEVSRLKQFPVTLLAEKVETPEEYDRCRDLGFGLFQGYFFARPRLVTGRRTPSDRLTTLRLIASLNAPDMSLKEVESLIVREPVLAQKLLKFINSTHVGLRVPVNSIGMAVALVGPRKLRSWATLLTLGRLTHCPREVLVTANIRAHMCETSGEVRQNSRRPNRASRWACFQFSTCWPGGRWKKSWPSCHCRKTSRQLS